MARALTIKVKDWRKPWLRLRCGTLHKLGVIQEMPEQAELDKIVDVINAPIRKCAHAAEYFVLTILTLFALRGKDTWNMPIKKGIIIALGICFVYSLTDEFHQLFVPARSGQFSDCVNDTLGGVVASIVHWIGYKIKNRKRSV